MPSMPICLVIKESHDSPSIPKLLFRFNREGATAITSETPKSDHFNVGWGRPAAYEGLNKKPPLNKLSEIQTLTEAGVKVVPYSQSFMEAKEKGFELNSRYILGRLRKHRAGQDIFVYPIDVNVTFSPNVTRDFWTQHIDKNKEYRVHVFNGAVTWVAEKIPRTDIERGPHDSNLVWSLATHNFVYSRTFSPDIAKVAIDAIKAYGVDFGAVDVIRCKNTNQYYALEVNLRPGVDGKIATYYVRQIIKASQAV